MNISVVKEIFEGEKRVSVSPNSVGGLVDLGFAVTVEAGAGLGANFSDDMYREAGASVVSDSAEVLGNADVLLKVRSPQFNAVIGKYEVELMKAGAVLVSFLWPAQNQTLLEKLCDANITAFAVDLTPRITRAQNLDALSSTSNLAGYRAIVEASYLFGRVFGGQTTAAGHIEPCKVLVIGAGVAGLSAIAAARSLGAVVYAFDTRMEVAEQISSMGAEFLSVELDEDSSGRGGYAKEASDRLLRAEVDLFTQHASDTDIIVSTALVPGKPAPKLLPKQVIEAMCPGSVVVDMAAEQGGNCDLTEPGSVVVHNGVSIVGYTDYPSRMANQASTLYANNLLNFMEHITPHYDGKLSIDLDDPISRAMIVAHKGEILWPAPQEHQAEPARAGTKSDEGVQDAERQGSADRSTQQTAHGQSDGATRKKRNFIVTAGVIATAVVGLAGLGQVAPESFMAHLTVFVLACFIGWQVIWNVTPALHTPLMSVTNAISGIIIIGGLLETTSSSTLVIVLAIAASLIATINIAGGFLVTRKMLAMFHKE